MIKYCKTSLVIGVLLVLTAFIPIVQVILMTINGGLLSLFVQDTNNVLIYLINSIGAMLFLVCYFYSNTTF